MTDRSAKAPSSGELSVREAALSDAAELAALLTQLGYPSTPAQVENRLRATLTRPDFLTLVAEDAGKTVGLAGVQIGPSYERDGLVGRLIALVVDEERRGRGIGSLLVRHVEAWLVEKGAERIVVNSATHRTEAHEFYVGLGYEITGVRLAKRLEA